MDINEMNRIRKLMGYTFEDIAGISRLPAETVRLLLAPDPEDLRKLEDAIRTLIRRDQASGNIIHEEVLPYTVSEVPQLPG